MTREQKIMNPDLRPSGFTPARDAPETRVTGHRSPVTRLKAKPWYREPWPWLLIAGPATVMVAGAITIWLAVESNDGLVADDYYRQGLAINRLLARDREAARLGIRARLRVTDAGAIEASLTGGHAHPRALTLTLIHPTHAGEDGRLALVRVAPDVYRSPGGLRTRGHRNVVLEDEAGTWRLSGAWTFPSAQPIELAPVPTE